MAYDAKTHKMQTIINELTQEDEKEVYRNEPSLEFQQSFNELSDAVASIASQPVLKMFSSPASVAVRELTNALDAINLPPSEKLVL